MQRYKISNHLTGVLYFGDSARSYVETCANARLNWHVNKIYNIDTGWDPAFSLGDNEFYVLDEFEGAIFLENAETGVKFWMSNGNYIQKIPVE